MKDTLKFKQLLQEFFIFYSLTHQNGAAALSQMPQLMLFMNFLNWYEHHSKRGFGNIDPKVSFILMFLATFQGYTIYPRLVANSANCVFTYMDTFNGTNTATNFIKLVPLERGNDNPIVDNVNALLVKSIARGMPAEKHIMDFVESFITFLPTKKTWDVPDDDNLASWPFTLEASRGYANASVMIAINGNAVKEARDSSMTAITFAFGEFFENVIVELGTRYGVLHNDLHLGNLFYVPSSSTIVMIDYGRMYVGAPPNIPGFTDFMNYEMFKNASHIKSVRDYTAFMQTHSSGAGVKNEGGDPRMCISDAITVCANMYLLSRMRAPHFEDTFADLVLFRNVKTIRFSTNNTSALMQIYCGIVNSYANHTVPEFFKYISILGEGLFLLVLLIISRMPEDPTSYLHSCFQFKYPREEFEKFLDFLDNELYNVRSSDPEFYNYFLSRTTLLSRLYTQPMVPGGALSMRASRPLTSRPLVARTLTSRARTGPSRTLASALQPIQHTTSLFDPVLTWGPANQKTTSPVTKLSSLKSFANKNYDSNGDDMSLASAEFQADQVNPMGNPVSPMGNPVSPKSNPVSPMGKPVSPKSKPVSPKSKPVSPKSKPVSPKSNQVSPKSNQVSPKSNQVSPKSNQVSPKSNQVSPKRDSPTQDSPSRDTPTRGSPVRD